MELYPLERNEVEFLAPNGGFFVTTAERTSSPTKIGRPITINFTDFYFIICSRNV
jgi:hypothetical protein